MNILTKIDTLLRRAKRATGAWRPDTYSITKTKGGKFRVFRTLWNGVAGSLNPGNIERNGINPYHEMHFETEAEAQRGILEDIAAFEKAHCMKLTPAPKVFNCCIPETDEERKEIWREQGGTVMELLAGNAGLTLESYIQREYGDEKTALYADIIRWRKEDGIDVEKTTEAVDTAGSTAGIN